MMHFFLGENCCQYRICKCIYLHKVLLYLTIWSTRAAIAYMEAHKRSIALIDLDCYYVQVFRRTNPALRGIPLGVRQKSLLATTSYEVRDIRISTTCEQGLE
jgi:hypothetical protein